MGYHGSAVGNVWIKVGNVIYTSCSFSLNDSMHVFHDKFEALEDTIRATVGGFLVAGDLNVRAREWGMEATNSKSKQILEMAARLGLLVLNTGNTPTDVRPVYGSSLPDITLVSENLANRAEDWRVLEDFTGSDYKYIILQLLDGRQTQHHAPKRPFDWHTARMDEGKFVATIRNGLDRVAPDVNCPHDRERAEVTVHRTMRLIR